MSRFYVTTAIPYVNARPHIGFALELVQADVIARYQRIKLGEANVHFLTGADENALKNVQAAEKEGKPTKDYVEEMSERFRDLAKVLNISNNDFIRTTEQRHIKGAIKLWQACKQEDIYKKSYSGLYCIGCEQYYTQEELIEGKCPEHKIKPELVTEENYFFKLSNYQRQLENLIADDELMIIPENRKNEMLAFIRRGLDDFSISRSTERARGWGVPVPGDSNQVMYVWFDALSNYLNALDFSTEGDLYNKFWDGESYKLHIIGKGITRFHCIYWPAMLLSAGLPLPHEIFVHGYVTVNGQKISKSLGNTVDPVELVNKYGAEAVRYYLLREIPAYEDGDFSEKKFLQRYESDLANGLGNTFSRVTNMIEKFGQGQFNQAEGINAYTSGTANNIEHCLRNFQFDRALLAIFNLLAEIDTEIDKTKPWEIVKSGQTTKIQPLLDKWGTMLLDIAWYLKPFLPETSVKMERIMRQNKITKTEPLFPRLNN